MYHSSYQCRMQKSHDNQVAATFIPIDSCFNFVWISFTVQQTVKYNYAILICPQTHLDLTCQAGTWKAESHCILNVGDKALYFSDPTQLLSFYKLNAMCRLNMKYQTLINNDAFSLVGYRAKLVDNNQYNTFKYKLNSRSQSTQLQQ